MPLHARSDSLAVWPPWMNISSGGPSAASSCSCSSPMHAKFHTLTRRSAPADARTASWKGDHATVSTSSVCQSHECTLAPMLRRSHSATEWSAEPVARTNSEKGLNATLLISALCAAERDDGAGSRLGERVSHTSSRRSSPTDASRCAWWLCHATSPTTPSCAA